MLDVAPSPVKVTRALTSQVAKIITVTSHISAIAASNIAVPTSPNVSSNHQLSVRTLELD